MHGTFLPKICILYLKTAKETAYQIISYFENRLKTLPVYLNDQSCQINLHTNLILNSHKG